MQSSSSLRLLGTCRILDLTRDPSSTLFLREVELPNPAKGLSGALTMEDLHLADEEESYRELITKYFEISGQTREKIAKLSSELLTKVAGEAPGSELLLFRLTDTLGITFPKTLLTTPLGPVLLEGKTKQEVRKEFIDHLGVYLLKKYISGYVQCVLYPSSVDIKKVTGVSASVSKLLKGAILLSEEEMRRRYANMEGYLALAKDLGEMNLGHLYSLASGLGFVDGPEGTDPKKLHWQCMSVPYAVVEKFQERMSSPEKYGDMRGYVTLAEELGEMHLGALYTLARGLGYVDGPEGNNHTKLHWHKMDVPYAVVGKFQEKMSFLEKYGDMRGYMTLAEELGEMHLSHLYSLARGLGYVDGPEGTDPIKLHWQQINVSYAVVRKFQENMRSPEKYGDMRGYVTLAKELGEMNFGHLYSLASGLGYVDGPKGTDPTKLHWQQINVPYAVVGKFQERMSSPEKYGDMRGYVTLAEELGEMHLGSLYSLASGLGYIDEGKLSGTHTEKLQWKCLEVSYEEALTLLSHTPDPSKLSNEEIFNLLKKYKN